MSVVLMHSISTLKVSDMLHHRICEMVKLMPKISTNDCNSTYHPSQLGQIFRGSNLLTDLYPSMIKRRWLRISSQTHPHPCRRQQTRLLILQVTVKNSHIRIKTLESNCEK